MTTIDDLNKSISEMTQSELESLILERRKNLRTTRESKSTKAARDKKEKKSVINISALSNDMKKQLLAELGGLNAT